jgi:hypothetical protein
MGNKLYVEGFNIKYSEELSAKNCSQDIYLRKSWISEELAENTKCELSLLQ